MQNCAADHGDLTGSVLDLVVAAPVVVQRQVLGCAMLGSTVEIILRQFKEGFRDEFPYFLRESGTLELSILRSILVSSCKHGRRGSGGVRLVKLHLELCSQRLPP